MPEPVGDLLPDLRHLRRRPELDGSLWREPHLVEHTFGRLHRVVRRLIDPPVDVLDLGCGLGYIALELAREGCRVVGIDPDEESVRLARAARDADPVLRGGTMLSYQVADAATWRSPSARFDVVVASRVLHHLESLDRVLDNVVRWLRPGGRLVCVELAYDRFDRADAAWLAQAADLLRSAGLLGGTVAAQPAESIARVWEHWWREHEEEDGLRTFDELILGLRGRFEEEHMAWHAYLGWDLLEQLEGEGEVGPAVARALTAWEDHLIAAGELAPVLFSWAGRAGNEMDPTDADPSQ